MVKKRMRPFESIRQPGQHTVPNYLLDPFLVDKVVNSMKQVEFEVPKTHTSSDVHRQVDSGAGEGLRDGYRASRILIVFK